MKWKKQLCAAAAVLLALGIALAGVLLNQHFLVLSGGISRTEMQSPLGDLVRSHLQLVALIVFATLAAAILALYHYKKQPELRYFLLYLAVLFFWGTLVAFFPAGFQGLLQRFMRLFFAITILASALLSAALLALPLPAKWVVPASAVFLLLGQVRLPILRFGTLTAGMYLCLYLLLSAYLRGYEAAGLLLFPCAITTGFRVWALLPILPFYVECYPLYLLRCARVFDIPFALGCMTYVCRRFALQFDRTEQLAQELAIPREEVVLAMDAIVDPVSLYEPIYSEGGDTVCVMDQVSDRRCTDESWIQRIALKDAISRLTPRERSILMMRFNQGKTQMEVSAQIGISQAQVSRLEKGAIRAIKKEL